MEVDRIWRIGGLDGQANPAWQNSAPRRRKFVEDVGAAEEEREADDEESAAQEQTSEQAPHSFSDDKESPAGSDQSDTSFRVIA